ncbi:MAG: hypothetical protein IKE28_08445 [Solobacterium sp.]|nr:hypothetical protein [Solobacterium sp.]
MIEHTIKVITLRRGRYEKKRKVIRFEDPYYKLVGVFLNSEATMFRSQIASAFKMAEETGEGFFAGNLMTLVIQDGTAVISSQLDAESEPVSLPAEELKALLNEWYSN